MRPSVEHDDIGVERLVVAETGSGLGMAAVGDEAWRRSSRWMSMRWHSCVVIVGSSGSASGPGTMLIGGWGARRCRQRHDFGSGSDGVLQSSVAKVASGGHSGSAVGDVVA